MQDLNILITSGGVETALNIIKCLIQKHNIVDNPPKTLEQLFYRIIFEKYFPNKGNTIPYFWMPKFTNAEDASARSLDIYSVRNN